MVEAAVVGFLGCAAGEALAGGGGGGGVAGVAQGAVREDVIRGAIGVATDGEIIVVVKSVIVIARVPPEVRLRAHGGHGARDHEPEPEHEVAGDVGAGVDGSVAEHEDEDVGHVPEHGEAARDEFPREEPEVVIVVGPVVVVVGEVVVVGDVGWEETDLVGQRPADEADGDEGEDDGEGAQDAFPEKGRVVGVHFPAGGSDCQHGFGETRERRKCGLGSFRTGKTRSGRYCAKDMMDLEKKKGKKKKGRSERHQPTY